MDLQKIALPPLRPACPAVVFLTRMFFFAFSSSLPQCHQPATPGHPEVPVPPEVCGGTSQSPAWLCAEALVVFPCLGDAIALMFGVDSLPESHVAGELG